MSNVSPINKTLIEWCADQFQQSGILDRVDNAGMYIHLRDPVGFRIDYYDKDGNIVPNYFRIRCRDEVTDNDSSEMHRGKYWQPKGLYQRLYWPKVLGIDHSANLCDISCPLFLVEGEKKALKLQSELLSRGIHASVAGLPGVYIGEDLLKELKTLSYVIKSNKEEHHRAIFLGFDFNDKGDSEGKTRQAENKVRGTLRSVGADVVTLRWATTPDDGPQKIDDWLVAGGDIKAAIQYSLDNKADTEGENYLQMLELNNHWAMFNGEFVRIDGPSKGSVLRTTQFLNENGHIFTEEYVGKRIIKVYAARTWIDWSDKRTMSGFCFQPPALGQPLQEWVNGKLNIAHPWAPIDDLPPWDGPKVLPTQLIDTLLRNFCEGEPHFRWLCQHIAHTLLHPNVPTSQVVLFCGKPGTGKTLLMDSFRKLADPNMLGGLAKSVRLDRKDDFNASLEGTVIAVYEEPLKGSHGKDIESLLKALAGTKTIEIRAMRKDTYQVPNYIHLFVAMNLRYLSHLGKDDRRCNFFEGKERIGIEDGANGFGKVYDEFMDSPLFAPTWLAWCEAIDLVGYSPQVLGPLSTARTKAIGFSSTSEEEFFDDEWFAEMNIPEVISNEQFMSMWELRCPRAPISSTKLALLAEEHGWSAAKVVKVDGKPTKLRARVNVEKWLKLEPKEWAKEVKKAGQAAKF